MTMKKYLVIVTTTKFQKQYKTQALWILSAIDNVVQSYYTNEKTTGEGECKEDILEITAKENP